MIKAEMCERPKTSRLVTGLRENVYISWCELCFCLVWLRFFTFLLPESGSGCPPWCSLGEFWRMSFPVFLFVIISHSFLIGFFYAFYCFAFVLLLKRADHFLYSLHHFLGFWLRSCRQWHDLLFFLSCSITSALVWTRAAQFMKSNHFLMIS